LEHTLQADAADVPALADALRAAIKVTRAAIGDQMQLDVQASAG
jgi:hypothetical protein